jgi:hypothetical protein
MIQLKPLHLLTSVCAILLAAFSSATTTYSTFAWSQKFVQGAAGEPNESKITADSAGNVYEFSETTGATQGYDLIRLNSAGVTTLSKHVDFGNINFYPTAVRVSPNPQGGLPFIYVCAQTQNTNGGQVIYVAKYNATGSIVWSQEIGGPTADAYCEPGGFDVDANGNVFTAGPTKYAPGQFELEMFEYSAAGVQLLDKTNQSIYPTRCYHVGTNWVTYSDTQWGVYSQSTGAQLAGQNLQPVISGSKKTSFSFVATPQRDSTILLVKNISVFDSAQLTQVFSHVVLCLSNAGGVAWVSPTYSLTGVAAAGNGISDPAYIICTSAGGGNVLRQLYGSGANAGKEIKEATLPHLIATTLGPPADVNGVAVYSEPVPYDNSIVVQRYDTGLNLIMTNTVNGSAASAGPDVSDSCLLNGNLYVSTEVDDPVGSTDSYDAIVQRYAPGITLSTLVATPSSPKGGTTFSLKVQLNAPAPAGGLLVTLSANSGNLAFSNNTQLLTLAIPAGSIYALVPVKTGAVAANTVVKIEANQSGVIRDLPITLTH